MNARLTTLVVGLVAAVIATAPAQKPLPAGYLGLAETEAMLTKTLRVHLDPDLSSLTERERATVDKLIETGHIVQSLYEDMRHHQARDAYRALVELDRRLGSPEETRNLLTLYYASKGPIARMLDNVRRPFVPVDAPVPGGNVYPWGVTREEIDAFLSAHPEERASILHPRTVVRRAERASLRRDLDMLKRHPALAVLHPGLEQALIARSKRPAAGAFYAVPYPVAYADELTRAHRLLTEAAESIAPEDADFAAYLRNRARDLLTNDYESGDAAWVTGRFRSLNAQVGSYETYDDELYGVKTYFGLNVLVRDHVRSDALRDATLHIQELEDSLPYADGKPHKRVRADIPVGVYAIVADFGQSRGANTATILPNDSDMARKYGRTILLRDNIMASPDLFRMGLVGYVAAVEPRFASDLTPRANSDRTLWHEIGHYLGVDRTHDGRALDDALEQASAVYEEMKADLVSLYVAPRLHTMGYYDDAALRSLYASGLRRVLQKALPGRDQPYQTMQLMQMNFYLEHGALSFDPASGKLTIHQDAFHAAVTAMLRETFEIQAAGDRARAEAFITRYTVWKDELHGRIATAMRGAETYRYSYVTYEALEGAPR